LRAYGFEGQITLVGDEPNKPDPPNCPRRYYPVVSASATSSCPPAATWLLGVSTGSLGRARRLVQLTDGREIGYDTLLIATGARVPAWPDPAAAS
jgi:3-phenylpropionate/trans-cinnamate dioxygenase ferredoxin reductase subunit